MSIFKKGLTSWYSPCYININREQLFFKNKIAQGLARPVELSMAPFSKKKLSIAIILGLFLALAPIVLVPIDIIPLHLSPNYWREPFFRVAAGVYLSFIGGFIFWLHPVKRKRVKK
jgi:hypothetical protein